MRRDDIVLLDGAVGTSLWEKTTDKGAVWRYNIENPAIVKELAEDYVDAGAQIILANTFGANRYAVSKTNYSVQEIVSTGVRLARETIAGRAKVALSAGPLPLLLEPYGDLSEEDAYAAFDEQISAGVAEKPDVIVLQTFMDLHRDRQDHHGPFGRVFRGGHEGHSPGGHRHQLLAGAGQGRACDRLLPGVHRPAPDLQAQRRQAHPAGRRAEGAV